GDDAAVVRLDGDRAVIVTTDFFTPVVDDLRDWGRIAAANALSDVYAMGGEPLVAVNLLAWPRDDLPFEPAAQVLGGGAAAAAEGGRGGGGLPPGGGPQHGRPGAEVGRARPGDGGPGRAPPNGRGRAGPPAAAAHPAGSGCLKQPPQGHRRDLPGGG